jgi:nicotinate-nucleotide adenylyltransferase
MRLGVYGGSFDPIHLGHLLLAESCREAAGLQEVWFVPAAQSPHKQGRTTTAAHHRLEMVRLAIQGRQDFIVCSEEIDRGGISYTVDTLEWIQARRPEAELFLLLGADSLVDLPRWRSPQRICELALPLVVDRPGSKAPDLEVLTPLVPAPRLQAARSSLVEMPQIGISSSVLRERVAQGRSIRYQTPEAVVDYIHSHGLYRRPTTPERRTSAG